MRGMSFTPRSAGFDQKRKRCRLLTFHVSDEQLRIPSSRVTRNCGFGADRKGYTDIEIDYRASKRDWLEAQDIAKSLGEDQWMTRASGELV